MKVAYIFNSPHASMYKLGQMILPQLEAGTHVVTVVGMFLSDLLLAILDPRIRLTGGAEK